MVRPILIVPIHDLQFIILPTLTTLLYKGITSLLSTSLGHSPISSFITSSSTKLGGKNSLRVIGNLDTKYIHST